MTELAYLVALDSKQLLKPAFEKFQEIFHFSYVIESDPTKIKNLLAKKSLKFLFIVENESPQFELLKELTHIENIKFIYFEDITKDKTQFRELKTAYHIDYVLELPIIEDEVAALIRALLREKQKAPVSDFIPPELLKKYNETIFDKIERIEYLINETKKADNLNDHLLEIRNEIHKITGNAAPYGYPEAGKLCAAHEMYLYNLYSGKSQQPLEQILGENRRFFRKLKLLFQHIHLRQQNLPLEIIPKREKGEMRGQVHPREAKSLIHAITSDFNLACFLQALASKRSIEIRIDDNPLTFLEAGNFDTAPPRLIITDEHFPYTKFSGLELIRAVKAKNLKSSPVFGILTDKEDLEKRIEWMESGIDFIIVKPVTHKDVEEMINYSLRNQASLPVKVLIVDDDTEFGGMVVEILRSVNINTIYLSDEKRLLTVLEDFNPDMLILDILLEKFNGKILLKALRKDSRYRDLLIIICSSLPMQEIDEWAYAEGCDAVIHKPLIPQLFLSRVINLFERKRSNATAREIDPSTGLATKTLFFDQVETLTTHSPPQLQWVLAYLKISLWEELEKMISSLESKQILILFAENMKSYFSTSISMAMLSSGYFSLLFKGLSGSEIELLFSSFFEKVRSKMILSSRVDLQIGANASAVIFSAKDVKLEEIVSECEKGLLDAVREGANTCKVIRFGELSAIPDYGKKVILVDDDLDLCEIVEFAFEKYGFRVQKFHNLKDALLYFAHLPQIEKNTLIVLDRRLPDGDGIDLLRKIYDKFPEQIKAIFLSSVSSEQDILDALRAGAMDYLVKPFSVEVLMEKASILLSR